MEAKTLTLKQVGWQITGTAVILLWGGGIATIKMEAAYIRSLTPLTEEQLVQNLNDNGFGCQRIYGGEVHIHELYERGLSEFVDTKIVNTNGGLTDEKLEEILSNVEFYW